MNARRLRYLTLMGLLAFTSLGLSECGGSPTDPGVDCVDRITVLAKEPAYTERPETLTTVPGRLAKNCQADARYCYYLGDVRIYTMGNQNILDPFVGQDVLIVGKVVFPASGPGELWAGTICRLLVR